MPLSTVGPGSQALWGPGACKARATGPELFLEHLRHEGIWRNLATSHAEGVPVSSRSSVTRNLSGADGFHMESTIRVCPLGAQPHQGIDPGHTCRKAELSKLLPCPSAQLMIEILLRLRVGLHAEVPMRALTTSSCQAQCILRVNPEAGTSEKSARPV